MPYRLEIKPQPEKALEKIPNPYRSRITKAIADLAHDPRPINATKIVGSDIAYRVRVCDYRIIYEIFDRVLVIHIVRVAHRKDVYRGI